MTEIPTPELRPHQEAVIDHLDNGKILWGGVGSGKSITALAYYMRKEAPRDIYVITTAKKRDDGDWLGEAANFAIGEDTSVAGLLKVDSWNNIKKYTEVEGAFFVFDEQRLIGSGAWVKAFYKIAERNHWLILTATPGDIWLDYAPVFIANGYYRNITDFRFKHVRYGRHKYPKVVGYLGVRQLEELRNDLLVEMPYERHTIRHLNYIDVEYDEAKYTEMIRRRWNPWTEAPMVDAAELFRCLRRLVGSDSSRLEMVRTLLKLHPRLIIFYNFNYELDILRQLRLEGANVLEWNGHRKDRLPDEWNGVYLVQYVAGAEGWNCVSTDAMVMYSLTYSYKNFEQAQGRIDRLNTKFTDLYYYVLVTSANIDAQIRRDLAKKRDFNENAYVRKLSKEAGFDSDFG